MARAEELQGLSNRIAKIAKDAEIVSVEMLGAGVQIDYEDSEECEWFDDPKTKKKTCRQRSGKQCPTNRRCISYKITFTQDGVRKIRYFCECSSA